MSALALAGAAEVAHAGEFSPYLPAPGGGYASVSFIRQDADTILRGTVESVRWNMLVQETVLATASYGLSDRWAIDARVGYADTDFQRLPTDPISGQSGVSDGVIGLRFRALDEFSGAPVTLTLGASGIIQGLYTPTVVDGIGDGASGAQFGLSLGKFVTPKFSVTGEVGYRNRFNGVPGEVFWAANLSYAWNNRFSTYGGVTAANALSGLDLGAPGVTSLNFPQLQEDSNLWDVGGSVRLAKGVSLFGGYGRKFGGRNTTNGPFFRIGVGYSF